MSVAKRIRIFVLFEAAAFLTAASIHLGWLSVGYEHQKAGIAESVIAAVLLVGLVWSRIRPASTRRVGVAAQAFALFGTLVGLVTIAIGVGPRTIPDIAYHFVIVAVLAWGLVVARRASPATAF
jgi:predicted small integral membrane protein